MYDFRKFYVNGAWVDPVGGAGALDVINPATEESVGQISLGSDKDVDQAVAAARAAFETFSQSTLEERTGLLERIVDIYKRRFDDVAKAITAEMGAPHSVSQEAQTPSGVGHFEQTLATLRSYAFEEAVNNATVVYKEPIGVCGFITPWNWPINQIAAKLGPALAVGCTVVHKPSEIAPLSSHILAEILEEAGVPKGVYNLIDGDGPTVGAYMASHPDIDMISFTGSTRAGVDVARNAAPSVKRVTQELGGKSPNIILDDADFPAAVNEGALACFYNTGQSCNAPTRMLVPQDKMDEAMKVAGDAAATQVVGDPTAESTNLGPIAYDTQYGKVMKLIQEGIDEGATLVCGGPDRPAHLNRGYFVSPTVFGNVTNDMTIAREEVFGPVLAIIGYKDEDDAIRIANDTPYGLSSYVSSGNAERAGRVARRLRTGMVHINGAPEDLAAPFGGYKQSGNGREFGSFGFDDFVEIKAVMGDEAA
ncbi:MAG: aldehyde dehydrogenase family protein [Pseudomonadota bacterium]